MAQDEHELLDLLKFELKFLEDGGYGRSPHTPWRPQLAFEDSPTCPNFRDPARPHPCTECLLMRFVPGEFRDQVSPCRLIPLTDRRSPRRLVAQANQPDRRTARGGTFEEQLERDRSTSSATVAGVCDKFVCPRQPPSWVPRLRGGVRPVWPCSRSGREGRGARGNRAFSCRTNPEKPAGGFRDTTRRRAEPGTSSVGGARDGGSIVS